MGQGARRLETRRFLLIQFGHNDGGPPDRDRARGSLPGIGHESKEFTLPDGKQAEVYTFGWYLRFIATVHRRHQGQGCHAHRALPDGASIWANGRVERGSGSFGKWSAEVARAAGVQFLDVTDAIADRYEIMGEEKVKTLFPEDHTHTSPEGANLNASLVGAYLNGLNQNPLAAFLSAKGKSLQGWIALDLPEPSNPERPTLFLIGDSTVRNGRGDGSNGQWGWGEWSLS